MRRARTGGSESIWWGPENLTYKIGTFENIMDWDLMCKIWLDYNGFYHMIKKTWVAVLEEVHIVCGVIILDFTQKEYSGTGLETRGIW